MRALLTSISLAVALAGIPAFAGSILYYEATPLGTLGGPGSVGYGINESGVVVGESALPAGTPAAFLSDGLAIFNPGWLPGATESEARDVNSSGTLVGVSQTAGGARATIWSGGTASALDGVGGGESYALAINNAGQIAGGNGQAFIYHGGSWIDIGAEWGALWSAAYGINESGQTTGYGVVTPGVFRGFVRNAGGGVTTLGTLGGANSYAFGINNAGAVVGHAGVPGGPLHAFLYSGGVMADLGTLGGGSSFAYGINDAGWVTGYSWLAGAAGQSAFLYRDGDLFDLNNWLINPAGWQLTEAYAINNSGQITGAGLFRGQRMAFRLDPVLTAQPTPEPATWSMITLGLTLLSLGALRRKT